MNSASQTVLFSFRHSAWAGLLLVAALLVAFVRPQAAQGQSTPPIQPQSSSVHGAGTAFWIEVQVGSEQAPVEDLFGVSVTLTYDTSRVTVQDDEAGPFLGSDVVYSSNVDDTAGEVGIGVSRKSGDGGVDGAGVVARVKVQVDADVPEGDTLTFQLTDVSANDPDGNPISLDRRSRGVTIASAIPMQPAAQGLTGETDGTPAPGDTIAVDVTVGTSAIPVSDLFGASFTLTYETSGLTVLDDTAGAFLGSDLVYSSNLDTTNGTVGVGVSRKAGAGGVDGAGSVARVQARVDTGVAEGETLTFGLTEARAENPADSSIALTLSGQDVTVNAIPDPPQDVNGTVNGQTVELTWTAPNEPDLDRYRIYRDTTAIDSTTGPTGRTPLDSTSADTTTFIDSTGTPGTTYYYRLTAVDSLGSGSGFSNEAQAQPTRAPLATTDSVSAVTDSSAVLYGTVNAGGDTTQVQFRYYPTGSPSEADTVQADQSPLVSVQDELVRAEVRGLQSGKEYTYQTLASNAVGRDTGSEQSFRVGVEAPVAETGPPSSIADSSVTLTATVDPGGDSTIVAFEYGLDSSYGSSVAADTITGADSVDVSASVEGLLPGTTYHYRVTASNDTGSDAGADSTVTTDVGEPVAATDSVRNVTDTTATVYGTVNPGGGSAQARVRYYPSGSPSQADTTTAAESPVTGTQDQVVTSMIVGLQTGTDYTYQVLATNGAGTAAGTERSFTTGLLAPVARNDTARVRRGASRVINVLANDVADGNLAASTVTVETGPFHGTASVNGDGTITYVHDGSSTLSDSLTYTVADQVGQRSDPATVILNGVNVRVEEGAANRGASVPITLVVEGGFAPDADTLYVRAGGGDAYQAFPLSEQSLSPVELRAQIPSSLVTARGVDYYAVLSGTAPSGRPDTITVPAGGRQQARQQPAHLPVRFDSLSAPLSLQPRVHRMLTIPARPERGTKAALREAYGAYDRSVWRALRWDAGSEEYREYPDIDSLQTGEAFWLITAEGEAPLLGPGRTPKAGGPKEIPIEAGWNQIGSPFGFAVPWSAVLDSSGLGGAAIDGPVSYRDSGGYQRGEPVLRRWEGYFVFSAEADTLVVPPVGEEDVQRAAGGPKALAGSDLIDYRRTGGGPGTDPSDVEESASSAAHTKDDASPYTLRVQAGTEATGQSPVWLGLRAEARPGRDHLDFAKAPPIGRLLRLSAIEQVAGRSVPHAGSFKPPVDPGRGPDAGRSWELRLENQTDEDREVRLQVETEGERPKGLSRYVLDLSSGRRIAPGQRLDLEAGERRALKVIVGTKAFAKAKSEGIELSTFKNELRGNVPNPFGGETQIGYTLGESREVTVEIYDVLGRRVRTLVSEKKQGPGLHRVRWAGENRYGEPVGSGVYFYRIRAEGFTETRKMVLVR